MALLLLAAGVAAQEPTAGAVQVGTEVLTQSGPGAAMTPGVGATQIGWLGNFQQSFGSEGLLTLSLDSATDGNTWQNGNNLITWRNLPFAGGRWFLQAGTLNFSTDLMPVHFSSLYSPDVYVSGGEVEYQFGGLRFTAFGGRELIQEGPYLPFFASSPEDLSGVQMLFSGTGPLRLEARYFHSRATSAASVLAPLLGQPPASADNFYLDGDYRLGKNADWLGELVLSRARPEGDAQVGERQDELNFFLGPELSRPTFDLQAYVLSEGANYLPLANVISGDRTGAYASLDLHPGTMWAVSSSLADYRSGTDGSSGFADSDAVSTSGAVSFTPGNGYSLVASGTDGQIEPVTGAVGPSLGLTTAQLQASRSYGANRSYLRFQDWISSSTLPGGDSAVRTEEFEQDRTLGGDSLSGIIGLQQSSGGAVTLNGQLGGDLALGKWLSLSGSAQLGRDLRDETALSLETYRTVMLLATVHLPAGFALQGEWIHNSSVSDLNPARVLVGLAAGPVPLLPALSQQTLFVRLTKTLHWGHGLPLLAGLPESAAEQLVPTYSTVSGLVFNDRAGTGRWAPGDSGIAGVEVSLSGRTAVTDAAGRFAFSAVPSGQYLLGLDMDHLPAQYSAPNVRTQLIRVGAEAPRRLAIPLRVVGTVSGQLLANGQPLPGAELSLLPEARANGAGLYAFTDARGQFQFQDVLPGTYRVAVDLSSAPAGARLAAAPPALTVASGGTVQGLVLRLWVPVHHQAVQTTVEAAENIAAPPAPRATASAGAVVAPAPAAAAGAAPRTESLAERFQDNIADVYFGFDRSALDAIARETLRQDAAWLRAHARVDVVIQGFCDARGSAKRNTKLGRRRADAARDYLIQLGIAAGRIQTVSYGTARQFCTLPTRACWQSNRRDHIVMAAGGRPYGTLHHR